MKKLWLVLVFGICLNVFSGCSNNKLIVYTESGFAPFEYVSNGQIQGVDVEIMKLVGEKLGKEVVFEDVPFNTIIDAVSEGKLTNIGAAGLSVTEERLEKVDFSKEYYQANLYVIYKKDAGISSKVMTDGVTGVYWSSLQTNKGIGVQTGTTADLFLGDEVKEGGSLEGVKTTGYDKLDTACQDIGINIDYVIVDELPAKMLVNKNKSLGCLPLYYEGETDESAYDVYAICVTKGQDELLNAINEVLDELLKEDESGISGIEKLVQKHLGLE